MRVIMIIGDTVKLKNDEAFRHANYLIDNDLLNEEDNMKWFVKYLINEYTKEHNIKLEFIFLSNFGVVKEMIKNKKFSLKRIFDEINVLGKCKSANFLSNRQEIYIYVDDKILRKNKNIEQLLFTSFHELGHAVTNKLINDEIMIATQLHYFPLYSKKYYDICKENYIIKLIGKDSYKEIHDFWLSEWDADIVGGNILLNMIDNNFGDKINLYKVRQYVEERIIRAKLILHNSNREQLLKAEDKIIQSHNNLADNKFFLRVEYNEDGSRKNLYQLFEIRRQLKDDLNCQIDNFYFGTNKVLKDNLYKKIEMMLDNNDELIGGFIYRVIEHFNDEQFINAISDITEEEFGIILDCINKIEFELKDEINFIVSNSSKEEKLKINAEKYLLSKLDNCL